MAATLDQVKSLQQKVNEAHEKLKQRDLDLKNIFDQIGVEYAQIWPDGQTKSKKKYAALINQVKKDAALTLKEACAQAKDYLSIAEKARIALTAAGIIPTPRADIPEDILTDISGTISKYKDSKEKDKQDYYDHNKSDIDNFVSSDVQSSLQEHIKNITVDLDTFKTSVEQAIQKGKEFNTWKKQQIYDAGFTKLKSSGYTDEEILAKLANQKGNIENDGILYNDFEVEINKIVKDLIEKKKQLQEEIKKAEEQFTEILNKMQELDPKATNAIKEYVELLFNSAETVSEEIFESKFKEIADKIADLIG